MVIIILVIILIYSLYRATKDDPVPDISFLPEYFVVFDLETTGLSPCDNEIIEIAALKINGTSLEYEAFQALVKPIKDIPANATKINGITQEMVNENGKMLSDVLPDFLDFIEDHRLVAFNANFDMGFIRTATHNHGYKIKNKHSCALKMARKAFPGLKSYKLEYLAKKSGLSIKGNHRALKDCELAASVYLASALKLKSIS